MHRIQPEQLWLGHVGDVRNIREIYNVGIRALVDLAINEPLPELPRDLIYCRFPLTDGSGNAESLIRIAVETAAMLIQSATPTLVFCSAGLSRTPAIAAAALSLVRKQPLDECLKTLSQSLAHDVSPTLWQDIHKLFDGPA